MNKPPTVYFIQAGDDGPIKIGSTTMDPATRRNQMQPGCPWPLHLIGSTTNAGLTEPDIHRRFGAHRIAGEWFEPVAELLEFIARNCGREQEPLRAGKTGPSSPVLCNADLMVSNAARRRKNTRRMALQRAYEKSWQDVALEFDARLDLSQVEIAQAWAEKTGLPFSASTVCRTISTAKRIQTEGAAA